ncbi:hypothetical protein HHI36_003895 [Cryptolaemus montrouzieri]|uniref:Uncharacterized protein n=1 Tax=Cryptolaemus montrouzieri TaxID=559131 RepID=A0ABD2NQ79_9CUCU
MYNALIASKYFSRSEPDTTSAEKKAPDRAYSGLSYKAGLSERLFPILSTDKLQIAFRNQFKDFIPVLMQSDVVYKASCKNYKQVYIGPTSRYKMNILYKIR